MAKALSYNEIRANLRAFAVEYREDVSEHAEYTTFWNDLLACFGVIRRQVASFQEQATRASTGNTGFIDFFWRKVVIGEHKSLGKMGPQGQLAEEQAFDYLAGGDIAREDFPRYIISTDFSNFRLTDLEGPTGVETIYFPLSKIADHAEDLGFLAGYQRTSINTEVQDAVSIAAADKMAKLYAALTEDSDKDALDIVNEEEEEESTRSASILLTRLLFLMFGDDAGLWQQDLFHRFIRERTVDDGSDLAGQLYQLFRVLNTPEHRRPKGLDPALNAFPYVNGHIFDGNEDLGLLAFTKGMRDALLEASAFDWKEVSPAVFGSLFQTVKSKEARRSAGEHYTTENNILKLLNPLFLEDYAARVRAAWDRPDELKVIHNELANNVYMDPACGCGNFLVIAYRELRAIELKIITRLRELEDEIDEAIDVSLGLRVSLDQFHGIEINWWPAKIAETAMFLVDHQANRLMAEVLGHAPNRLPINISAHIHHANALDVDWKEILPEEKRTTLQIRRRLPIPIKGQTFIFGNPPFLGHATRTKEQAEELRRAWGRRDIGRLDYVTSWHAKTLDLFGVNNRAGEWAFVTTSSITQGEPVPALFGPIFENRWKIKFAHRTFAWTSEATGKAAVHCVIIGFTRNYELKSRLFEYPDVKGEPQEISVRDRLNAYLVDGANVLVEQRRTHISEHLAPAVFGNMPRGKALIIEPDAYEEVVSDPIAAKYIRPFKMGRELIHDTDRWCLWMVDLDPSDISKSPVLKKRISEVKQAREESSAASTRDMALTPHLFGQRSQPSNAYLAIPAVFSESRLWATCQRLPAEVIAGNKIYTVDDPDGFAFAVVSSSMFITWQKTVGGRLKSDPNFSNTIVWNTLPLPPVDNGLKKSIIDAGKKVLEARALHPERSLAQHYNPLAMDPALLKAHAALDRVVDKAFGSKSNPTEAERQATLFKCYAEMTKSS